MQNSGGAVIPMKWSDKIEYIVGCKTDFANITENRPLVPFSQNTVDFLAALSGKLRSSGALGKMPDAAAFAFWCRRAHLEKLKEAYVSSEKKESAGV